MSFRVPSNLGSRQRRSLRLKREYNLTADIKMRLGLAIRMQLPIASIVPEFIRQRFPFTCTDAEDFIFQLSLSDFDVEFNSRTDRYIRTHLSDWIVPEVADIVEEFVDSQLEPDDTYGFEEETLLLESFLDATPSIESEGEEALPLIHNTGSVEPPTDSSPDLVHTKSIQDEVSSIVCQVSREVRSSVTSPTVADYTSIAVKRLHLAVSDGTITTDVADQLSTCYPFCLVDEDALATAIFNRLHDNKYCLLQYLSNPKSLAVPTHIMALVEQKFKASSSFRKFESKLRELLRSPVFYTTRHSDPTSLQNKAFNLLIRQNILFTAYKLQPYDGPPAVQFSAMKRILPYVARFFEV